MPLVLDGQPLESPPTDGQTLRDVLDRVRAQQPAERLIVGVKVNGRTLLDEDLSLAMQNCLCATDTVELTSGELGGVVAEAFRGVAGELRRAGAAQADVAAQLQTGNTQTGLQRVGEHVALWQSTRQAIVDGSDLLGIDLTATPLVSGTVGSYLDHLVQKLTELRDTFESNDMVALADLVQYEWPALYEQWAELFDLLAERVSDPQIGHAAARVGA